MGFLILAISYTYSLILVVNPFSALVPTKNCRFRMGTSRARSGFVHWRSKSDAFLKSLSAFIAAQYLKLHIHLHLITKNWMLEIANNLRAKSHKITVNSRTPIFFATSARRFRSQLNTGQPSPSDKMSDTLFLSSIVTHQWFCEDGYLLMIALNQ